MQRKEDDERQWKEKLKRSWTTKNTTSSQQLSHLEEMSKGVTKGIGEGTIRNLNGVTTCPYCADPMGSPKGVSPSRKKTLVVERLTLYKQW